MEPTDKAGFTWHFKNYLIHGQQLLKIDTRGFTEKNLVP